MKKELKRETKLHILKIKPDFYISVMNGTKTFEIRKDDRDYEVGDFIRFVPFAPDHANILYPGCIIFTITYILRDAKEYGLMDGYCILGIER